eukprot:TRINITY_DN11953_c0_g2_i1.p1 TRINITY_DN11953_c0_g2~~TRINITY_DN11953_c0_g2_i1.p1  ORF type:complete len:278 (+),score=52.96 TRINITY_DN11953_c0_g2_i1:108-941(+)
MARSLNIKDMAESLLPLAGGAITNSTNNIKDRRMIVKQIVEDMNAEEHQEESDLGQLYSIVDKMRIAAKDAANLLDRSFNLSHSFYPLIDSKYPCASAEKWRNLAHHLHLSIGFAKEPIVNPVTPIPGEDKEDASDVSPFGTGAADELSYMERRLGELAGAAPPGLHAVLEYRAIPLSACILAALTPSGAVALHQRSRGRGRAAADVASTARRRLQRPAQPRSAAALVERRWRSRQRSGDSQRRSALVAGSSARLGAPEHAGSSARLGAPGHAGSFL